MRLGSPAAGDSGVQPERTELAWRRTSLAQLALVLAIGKFGLESLISGVLVAVSAVALVGSVGTRLARTRRSPATSNDLAGSVPPAVGLVLLCASVAAVALAQMWVALAALTG